LRRDLTKSRRLGRPLRFSKTFLPTPKGEKEQDAQQRGQGKRKSAKSSAAGARTGGVGENGLLNREGERTQKKKEENLSITEKGSGWGVASAKETWTGNQGRTEGGRQLTRSSKGEKAKKKPPKRTSRERGGFH